MANNPDRWGRTLATLGMAISAPVALFSGIFAFITIPTGGNRAIITIFVFAFGGLVLSTALYLSDDLRHRNDDTEATPPSDGD